MARPRKYEDAVKLERKINRYFDSITREKIITEPVPTGQTDEYGHMTYRDEPVMNRLGQPVTVIEYVTPPTIADLCDYLRIDRSTWALYCNPDKHPEFFNTTTRARGRIQAWNEKELLTRQGSNVKGIIFNLENNYGYKERQSVDMSGSLESYIRSSESGAAEQSF